MASFFFVFQSCRNHSALRESLALLIQNKLDIFSKIISRHHFPNKKNAPTGSEPNRGILYADKIRYCRISCSLDGADEQPQLYATSQNRGEQRAPSQDLHGSQALS